MANTKDGVLKVEKFVVQVGDVKYTEFQYGDAGGIGIEIVNLKNGSRIECELERHAANLMQAMRTVLLSRQPG